MSGPGRSLGFVTLPAGQDPDDLVRAGGRAALDALLEQPEPLVDRLWQHELEAEPLATPEQRAGLRRRLTDHVSTIADGDVREQYRAELLKRFNDADPAPAAVDAAPCARASGGRFVPPPRPTSPEAHSVGRTGLSPATGPRGAPGPGPFSGADRPSCRGDRGACRSPNAARLGCAT